MKLDEKQVKLTDLKKEVILVFRDTVHAEAWIQAIESVKNSKKIIEKK